MNGDLNDIRHFLAVVRTGSTLAAGKSLGVNQTTSARRIAALERALGLVLFERTSSGYRATESAAALVAFAEEIEAGAARMGRAAEELRRVQSDEIRFSTSDVLADLVAGPAVADFAREHPHIRVTLHVDSRAVDLENGDADVALRAAPILDNPRLVARKVMETPWAFYGAAGGVLPRTADELIHHPLAALEGRPVAMLQSALPGGEIRYVSNSMKALVEMIRTSDCVGALPMLVGETQPGLARCFALDIDAGGLWVVFHERLRHAPHIRAFVDHLGGFVRRWRGGGRGRAEA